MIDDSMVDFEEVEREREFILILRLTEHDALVLARIMANVASANIAYAISYIFEQNGINWADGPELDRKRSKEDCVIYFKERV